MRTENKHPQDDPLLDAVLGDDAWAEISAATKSAALAGLQARRRRRQTMFWLGQAAVIVLTAGTISWLGLRVSPKSAPDLAKETRAIPARPSNLTAAVAPAHSTPSHSASPPSSLPAYISEAELVALFPKGSCEVVEINGAKQLVFYDGKIEREGASYRPGG
jgi:hypothetical protein